MVFEITRDVLDALDPYKEEPHGDRYIVEEAEIGDEKTIEGGITFVVAESVGHYERGPNGLEKWVEPKSFEEIHGYFLGRVIAKGNGHRLERDEFVPMPFEVGDVLRIERFTGRKFKFQGRNFRLVNQVDCLSRISELSPMRTAPTIRGKHEAA
jgi:hypothetical protein